MSDITPQIALQQIIQNSQQVILEEQQNIELAQSGLAYVPPAPPLDLADYMTAKPGRFVRPVVQRLLPDGRIANYLTRPSQLPNNFPMDGKILTTNDTDKAPGLYDRITDWPGHWQDPTAYRLYANQNSGTNQLGLKLAPRYFTPTPGRIQVASYHGNNSLVTQCFSNCTLQSSKTTQADVFFEYRMQVPFGGDLGNQDCPVSIYQYDWSTSLSHQLNKSQEQEEFYWVLGSSWAQWIHYQLQPDGSYKQDNAALYNKFIPDTLALPVFPCNIAL